MIARQATRFPVVAATTLLLAVSMAPTANATEPFGILHNTFWKVTAKQGPKMAIGMFDTNILRQKKTSCEQYLAGNKLSPIPFPEVRSLIQGSIWSRPTRKKYQPDYLYFERTDVEARAGGKFLANGGALAQPPGFLCIKGNKSRAVCYCLGR